MIGYLDFTSKFFEKKDNLFQSELDLDDIESHFNSCMKTYKSGKYIVIRCYIPNNKTIRKNYCLIYDVRPKACREFPHTDRKKFQQISNLTMKNVAICPAAYNIVEEMKKRIK